MRSRLFAGVVGLAVAVAIAGCASVGGPTAAPAASLDPATDKLAHVLARGALVGYAELDYPPQSIRVEGAARATDTKCLANQLTEPEVTGFDVETTKLVAHALGIEACFVSPQFSEVTAGSWGDRLDIAYGSAAINALRMQSLWMTQPYYYIPQRFIVRASGQEMPEGVAGKVFGNKRPTPAPAL